MKAGRGTLGAVGVGALFLQALFSRERRQGIGFAAALAPVARTLAGDERKEFLSRHVEDFNTNPAMAGPILGAVMRLEEAAVGGDPEGRERVERFKRAVQSPFAAAGDRLLWRDLRGGGVAAGCALGWVAGVWGPILFLVVYNLVHLGLRVGGVFWGYRRGAEAAGLLRSRRFRLVCRPVSWLGPLGIAAVAVVAGATGPLRPAVATAAVAAAAAGMLLGRGRPGTPRGVFPGAVLLGLALSILMG